MLLLGLRWVCDGLWWGGCGVEGGGLICEDCWEWYI